jgi:NADH-quinone oxidoreductase subunit G
MLAGDDHLLATARPPLALVSAGTHTRLGVAVGERVTLRGPNGTGTTLPVAVADLPDGVVWTPTTSATAGWAAEAGSAVRLEIPEGARP